MDEQTTLTAPAEWLESLDRADADVAAGRVYSGEEVRQRLRESIRRMKAGVETQER